MLFERLARLGYASKAVIYGIVGVTLAIYGISEVIQSLRGTHDSKLDWSRIPAAVRMSVQKVSQFGVGDTRRPYCHSGCLPSSMPSTDVLMVRSLGSMVEPRLSVDDVLYWRSDLF